MKPGYKQTNIGVMPRDWSVEAISSVADVKTGPFGSALHERDYVDDGTPIITVEHLSERGIIHQNLPLISDADRSRLKSYRLRADDIVFSRVGSVDRNSLIREEEDGWLFSGRLLRIRTSDNTTYPPYLSYHFHSEPFKRRVRAVAVGQTMASLNTQILKAICVVLPTTPEQRAIAEALSDADALIESLEQLLTKKRQIKKGALQELLTGKKRLPGFSGEWEVSPLRRFVRQFIVPMRDKPKCLSGDIPWCRIEDFDGMYLTGSKSGQGVDIETVRTMNLKVYQANTLLVSCSADLGRCAIVALPLVSNQTFIGLEMNEVISSNLFFYYFMISRAEELNNLSSGTTISYLSREQFEEFVVFVPLNKKEQTAIATILSDMDAEIVTLEAKLSKARQLKQGMMQELLTGRIRLI